jgi:hypothetical protein
VEACLICGRIVLAIVGMFIFVSVVVRENDFLKRD